MFVPFFGLFYKQFGSIFCPLVKWTSNKMCIFTFKLHKNERKRITMNRVSEWKRESEQRNTNSDICCTANNDVPSYQHFENHSLAHDIRMLFVNGVGALYLLHTTPLFAHTCELHETIMKTILSEHITLVRFIVLNESEMKKIHTRQ